MNATLRAIAAASSAEVSMRRANRNQKNSPPGGDDQSATPEKVAALQKEFAGASMEIVAYPGAVHAFTVPTAGNDPSKGVAYNKDADEKSWAKMKTFFATLFK